MYSQSLKTTAEYAAALFLFPKPFEKIPFPFL
jgi:hypothetical protein